MNFRTAAFLLPDTADVRAILFALADIDTDSAVTTQIERFTDANVLWVIAEGEQAQETIELAQAMLPAFGLTFTEV